MEALEVIAIGDTNYLSSNSKPKRRKKRKKDDDSEDFIPKRPRANICISDKMKILNDLQKGMKKADIARSYNISAGAVHYIFSRKDAVIEEYYKQFPEEDPKVSVDEALLNWFELKLSTQMYVRESSIVKKAISLSKQLKCNDFTYSDSWLDNFCTINNIVRNTDTLIEVPTDLVWKSYLNEYKEEDIYVLSTMALLPHLDPNNSVFYSLAIIYNINGADKRQLVTVVNESIWKELCNLKSLPVSLHISESSQITKDIIEDSLITWDKDLDTLHKSVILFLDDHPIFQNFCVLRNIKTVNISFENSHLSKMIKKVTKCFKFHFRRLQYSSNKNSLSSLDTIRLICSAWVAVSVGSINRAFHPAPPGTLSFDTKNKEQTENEENDYNSLSIWFKNHSVPIEIDDLQKLDDLLESDNNIECLSTVNTRDLSNINVPTLDSGAPSAMCAYDSMRRLSRYLQGYSASSNILKSVSVVENYVEYCALKEVCTLQDVQASLDRKVT